MSRSKEIAFDRGRSVDRLQPLCEFSVIVTRAYNVVHRGYDTQRLSICC